MALDQTWLENPAAVRHIFAEVNVYDVVAASEIVLYLSSCGYVTSSADVSFSPILTGSFSYSENMSLEGGVSFSVGDLEMYNFNGVYDNWLDPTKYIWVNRAISIYYGDPLVSCADIATVKSTFILMYTGIIADIDSREANTLNIRFRDNMDKINSPVTETKLGTYGTWANLQNNQDDIVPLVFGEVHNMEPMLIDPSTLEYYFNQGNSESVIEIRDNGVPIYTRGVLTGGATINHTTGKFILTHPLAGQITASIQGVKDSVNLTTGALVSGTYVNNIANLVALITTQYGKSYTRLTTSELDLTNLAAFASNTAGVGVIINSKENVIDICSRLVDSVGGQLYFNRLGKLQILRLGDVTVDPSVTITEKDMLSELTIVERTEVSAATKIGYCKNWTVQEGLLTGIPEQHKDMFATEWFSKTSVDGTVKSRYKLHEDPDAKETLLLTHSDATAEATRLNNFFKVPRSVYSFKGTSALLSLKLGQQVQIAHHRFNLYNSGVGTLMQIVGLTPNWTSSTIDVKAVNL